MKIEKRTQISLDRLVVPFGDSITLGMMGGGQSHLDSEATEQRAPKFRNELRTAIGNYLIGKSVEGKDVSKIGGGGLSGG